MSNPFQEQLLKAGLVSKQQVKQVNKEKQKKKKQQNSKKPLVDEAALRAQKAAQEKAQRDRELNQKKQQQARARAVSAEINQLIQRDDSCDLVYNFEHDKKVKRIYINQQMKQQLIDGTLALARIDGRYELVPLSVADKIKQRNEKRVIIFEPEQNQPDEDDPYADFQVPDDLIW